MGGGRGHPAGVSSTMVFNHGPVLKWRKRQEKWQKVCQAERSKYPTSGSAVGGGPLNVERIGGGASAAMPFCAATPLPVASVPRSIFFHRRWSGPAARQRPARPPIYARHIQWHQNETRVARAAHVASSFLSRPMSVVQSLLPVLCCLHMLREEKAR